MSLPRSHANRLLPRYPIGTNLELLWDVSSKRRNIGRRPRPPARARVRDLSLEGALVELPEHPSRQRGERLVVGFGGGLCLVEVVHRDAGREAADLCGIRFLRPDQAFGEAVSQIVALARSRSMPSYLSAPVERTEVHAVVPERGGTCTEETSDPERSERRLDRCRVIAVLLLSVAVCSLVTSSLARFGSFAGAGRSVYLGADLVAVGSAFLALVVGARVSSGSVRRGWVLLGVAALVGQGLTAAAVMGLEAGSLSSLLWVLAGLIGAAGLMNLEGSRAPRRAWVAVMLEATAVVVVLAALTSPLVVGHSSILSESFTAGRLLTIAVPVAFLMTSSLGISFALSSRGPDRLAFLSLSAWALMGSVTAALVILPAAGGAAPPAVAGLGLSVGAVFLALAPFISPAAASVEIESVTARADRGLVVVAPLFASLVLLGADQFGFVGGVERRLASLGLLIAVGRLVIMTFDQRSAAREISRELDNSRRREEELARARREAESGRRARELFLSRTSHELRTPLHIILGFSELLAEGDLDGPQTEFVDHVSSAGTQLLRLVEDLLDLSQIDSGRLALRLEEISVDELCREVIDQFGPMARAAGARIDHVPLPAATVYADRTRLHQVLVNLIANAVKYAGGRIEVSCDVVGPEVRLHVTDVGPGLSSEDLARVFEPFERVGAERGPQDGAGLGLVVAKSLCEMMAGSLEVASVLGAGSRFSVLLPSPGTGYSSGGASLDAGRPGVTGDGLADVATPEFAR